MFYLFLKDECSFVSLRDIERAMIVFKYFYEKVADFHKAEKSFKSLPDDSRQDVCSFNFFLMSLY